MMRVPEEQRHNPLLYFVTLIDLLQARESWYGSIDVFVINDPPEGCLGGDDYLPESF